MQNGDKSNGETWGRRANEVRRRGASTNDLQLRKLDNLSPKAGHSPRHDAKTCTPASRMLGLAAKAFKGTLPGWTWHAGISPAPSTLSKTAGDVRMMCEKVKGGEREPGKDLRKTHTHTHMTTVRCDKRGNGMNENEYLRSVRNLFNRFWLLHC